MKIINLAILSSISLLFSAAATAQSVDFGIGFDPGVEEMALELDFVQGERFIQAYGAVVHENGVKTPVDGSCLIEEREGNPWASCTLSFLENSIYFTISLNDGFGLLTFLPQDTEEPVEHIIWLREN